MKKIYVLVSVLGCLNSVSSASSDKAQLPGEHVPWVMTKKDAAFIAMFSGRREYESQALIDFINNEKQVTLPRTAVLKSRLQHNGFGEIVKNTTLAD